MKKVVAKNALTIYEKYGEVGSVALSSEQILHILQKTPKDHVYTRPAKGGGNWDFVTGAYVEKVLNYVFGWDWDFEIKQKEEKYNQIIVTGRLTVRTMNGKTIVKEQIGRADIKFKKNTQIPLDYGNDEKAAATDALKKCASKLGIASDIYGKNEFKEIQTEVVDVESVTTTVSNPSDKPTESQIATLKALGFQWTEELNMTKQEAANKIVELSKGK